MSYAPLLATQNPYLRANSLAELLNWEDVDFVRCAYVTILGRQPDKEGEHFYTRRLRSGDSKYAILWQLRRSEEGPRHDPGIAGLDRALKREALRRNRLVGWLVRAAIPGEGTSRQDRRIRQLYNRLAIVAEQQSAQTQAISSIQARNGELTGILERIAGDLARLANHVVSKDLPGHLHYGGTSSNPQNLGAAVNVRDDLDLSSRERAVLQSIKSARY